MQSGRARVIFNAAVDVFSTRGFDGATMDEIAQKANVAKGTIYYHFNSKEDLFLFLVAEGTELLHDAVLAKLDPSAPPTANLELAIREQLHFFHAYRDFCTIIVREAWGDDTRQRQFRKMLVNYVRTLAAIIDRGRACGTLHVENSEVAAWSLFGAVSMTAIHHLYIDPGYDLDRLYPHLAEFCLRGFGVPMSDQETLADEAPHI
ncbi:MAG: TetR/AcrR family transcriptional regulator [Firmicutes bacterium]|nr:TetR/AcrR family transcriptional regulator [Bacillota bacterium]